MALKAWIRCCSKQRKSRIWGGRGIGARSLTSFRSSVPAFVFTSLRPASSASSPPSTRSRTDPSTGRTLRSPSIRTPARGGRFPTVKVTSRMGFFDNTLGPCIARRTPMGRQFNEDTLTAEVVKRLGKTKNPRLKQIMGAAVKHLHAFARDVQLTEEEWFEGIKFLTAVGQKCDDKRQEFILLSDVLGLSMMVVALNHKASPGATEPTVLGPFFAHGAKEYGYGGDLRQGATMKGEDVWVSGRVLTVDGKPIPNATLDIWQAKADGIYG